MRVQFFALVLAGLAACSAAEPEDQPFEVEVLGRFQEPWAMTFLPDGRLLVTEQAGRLLLVTPDGARRVPVAGVPAVDYGGQGGLGDVVLDPQFGDNHRVYLSYAEAGEGDKRGAAVARGTLTGVDGEEPRLEDLEVIWRQQPKVTGRGHYGHRLAFSPEGLLFISSGERQKFDPAQDMQGNLGKILRLHADGTVPADNPFAGRGGVTAQIWSLGHRNPLGLAFDAQGQLWNHEMGPRHGDELNRVMPAANYGYPEVSNGDHYSGEPIPDHGALPGFEPPVVYWVPAISPAGLVFYSGRQFPAWRGNALIGGLSSRALVRVAMEGEPREVARYDMGARIREVEQGPGGAIWLLEDEDDDSRGRLLRLTPVEQSR